MNVLVLMMSASWHFIVFLLSHVLAKHSFVDSQYAITLSRYLDLLSLCFRLIENGSNFGYLSFSIVLWLKRSLILSILMNVNMMVYFSSLEFSLFNLDIQLMISLTFQRCY